MEIDGNIESVGTFQNGPIKLIIEISPAIVTIYDETFEAFVADTAFQFCNGLVWRSGRHGRQACKARRVLLHRVGEVIVGVARHSNGIRRLHLFHTGRRQRQDLHIDAGRIHFPQPFGAEVTKPVHNLGVAAADLFGAVFDKTCGSIEKFRGRKMLLKSNGAHTRSSDLYWGICSGAYREIVNYMAAAAGPACSRSGAAWLPCSLRC